MAIPRKDAELVAWSTNFDTRITATPTAFGLTAPLATAYATLHDAYVAAYTAASNDGTRSKSLVATKDAAKLALLANARDLYQIVQGTPSVTDAQRQDLGVTVRKTEPTPVPAPALAPGLLVKSVSGWTARIRLVDAGDTASRGKPAGVNGASVFSHVGATPPADISNWKFEGNTGRTTLDVLFPSATAPGAAVWLTAFWFNSRKQSGPACAPVSTNLPGGSVSMAA